METSSIFQNAICDWTLDLDRGLIFKFGKPVVIRHKLFELLAYLVKNPNRVVSKDELI